MAPILRVVLLGMLCAVLSGCGVRACLDHPVLCTGVVAGTAVGVGYVIENGLPQPP